MEKNTFSFGKRLRSFTHAFRGIKTLITYEHNAWIHCCATFAVCAAGWFFRISGTEWICVFFAIGGVLAAEAFNTVIEKIADFISPQYDERIKVIKDIAAGAVLLIAIAAALTGCIIFIPKILLLLR
ncbi:MAG: diacylglycerol kinase family protein [Tannerellaceae bacterium]|nr:diacylglycerol kinase family protein [Tannerellaceae bacterium]